jgi:predicted Ser/Thr protein kinase
VSCPSPDEIVAYVDGDLSTDRRAAIARHAADCASCRVALSALARTAAVGHDPGAAPAEPLRSIGRYVIVERIGRGAMGVVYRAQDPQLDREVAVKLLDQRLSASDEWLMREARALARIDDARVVTVFDAGLHQDRRFVVMEYVAGVSLSRWLQEAPRSWRQVLQRFLEAGRGLQAVHAAGIVHGDFKPDNVLVGHDARVRVTDFGLARWTTSPTQPLGEDAAALHGGSVAGGTPAYMAPEQFAGQRGDALSDQFSFAVSLYEGLCGQRPFGGRNLAELMAAIGKPPKPPSQPLPRWLVSALIRALAPDRHARFPSLAALIEHLENRLASPRRLAIAAFASLLLVGVGLLLRTLLPQPDRSCRIEARRLGAPWAPERLAPGVRATADFVALDHAVRSYLADWVTVRVGACEDAGANAAADHVRFARRMSCLDERRDEILSLTSQLTTAADVSAVLGRLDAMSRPHACMLK